MAYNLITGTTSPRDWGIGSPSPPIWTPSSIRSEMQRIIAVFDLVNQMASQALSDKKISPVEWQQWKQIYNSSHSYLSSASPYWGSNIEVARGHEDLALRWHAFITSKGGVALGPGNPGRVPDPNPIFDKWTWAIVVGGIAASAMLVSAVRK